MPRVALQLMVLFVALVASACASARSTAATAGDQAWRARTSLSPVAFVGLPLRVILERSSAGEAANVSQSSPAAPPIAFTARCMTCSQSRVVHGTARPPASPDSSLGSDRELVIVGLVFPEPGQWAIEPFSAVIAVRDPRADQDPVVEMRGSSPAPLGCDAAAIASVMRAFGEAERAAQADSLQRLLTPNVDFSDSGTALAKFMTRDRQFAIQYLLDRHSAGERWYPLSVRVSWAASADTVDLFVTAMRSGSDLGSGAADNSYVSVIGSGVRCGDRTISRWNSDLLKLDPRAD